MGLLEDGAAARAAIAETSREIQSATGDLQKAAAESLSAARTQRSRILSLQQKRRSSESSLGRASAVIEPLRRDVSTKPEQYTAQKRDGRREYASYLPVTLEERPDGFVKTYRGTYTRRETAKGYEKEVYARRIETYDANGRLVNVKEYTTADRSDAEGKSRGERVRLSLDQSFEEGALAKSRVTDYADRTGKTERSSVTDYRTGERRVKDFTPRASKSPGETIYEFTSAEGRKYRVPDNAAGRRFALSKGVDIDKALDQQRRGTFTLRESGTGKEYEAKKETMGGVDFAVGIRSVPESEQAARAGILSTVTPVSTARADSIFKTPGLSGVAAENVAAGRNPNTILGPDALAGLRAPTTSTRTDLGRGPFELPGKKMNLLQASTEPQRYGSSFYSEEIRTNIQLARAGKPGAALTAAGAIAVTPLVGFAEILMATGKPLFTAAKTPLVLAKSGPRAAGQNLAVAGAEGGELLLSPVFALMQPRETLQSVKDNPLGTLGQVGGGLLLGKFAGLKYAERQTARAKLAAETQLAEAETTGRSVVTNDRLVETTKITDQTVKFNDRLFRVTAESRETAGILGATPGLITGSDALALARGATGSLGESAVAGAGASTFRILEGPKLLARGTGATTLGGVDELFARISRTESTIIKTGKTTRRGEIEIGRLTPGIEAETRVVPEGARIGQLSPEEPFLLRAQRTEGRSIQLREEGVAAKTINIDEIGRSFETDRVTIRGEPIVDVAPGPWALNDPSRGFKVLFGENPTPATPKMKPVSLDFTQEGIVARPSIIDENIRITSEPIKLDVASFTTSEKTGPLPALKLPANPLEATPEFAFRQMFGEKNPTALREGWYLGKEERAIFTADQLTAAPKPTGPSMSLSESMRRASASKLLREFEAGRITPGALGGSLNRLGLVPTAETFGKVANAELKGLKTSGLDNRAVAETFSQLFAE